MARVLALDAGTTGVAALLYDEGLQVRAQAYREFPQQYPEPGWVEHDPEAIWVAAQQVLRDAVEEAGEPPEAIGITDQRETTVLWDRRSGRPVHNALVWQDRRTAARCRELREEWQETVQERTGLVLDPYFSATKLEWLLQNVAGAKAKAAAGDLLFGTVDSWLVGKLTGVHATDVTNASRTLLWDIHRSDWDLELLELFGIPEAVLPDVVPSAHRVGETELAGRTVPVTALVGDQQSALFGQGCHRPGEAKNTYGTGCFLLQHTGTAPVASRNGLLTTRAAAADGQAQYALEGSVFIGGAAVQWLRDGLKLIDASPDVNTRAQEGDDSGGVVVVPAFAGLGAPHWDPEARGAILGLTRGTSRRHIARATLESIAFQSQDVLEAMEKDSGTPVPELNVDGGAARSELLLQFQADLLQRPVVRAADVESTARGAAMLAGIGAGSWSLEDVVDPARGDRFEPRMDPDEVSRRRRAWQAAIDSVRAFKPMG